MARLTKWRGDRQRELFDRAEIPALVPTLRHFEDRGRRVAARQAATPRPFMWSGLGSWARQFDADDRQRRDRVGRQLTVERIRACRHREDLERVEHILAGERAATHGCLADLRRVWTRAELGELLVETRNRIRLLELGRDRARERGPCLDPKRIPLDRLEHLIQRHPNMELVERLRLERSRRISAPLSAGSV